MVENKRKYESDNNTMPVMKLRVEKSLCLVDRASFVNTLFLFQLDTLFFFSLYIYNFLLTIFSTCFGPAGPSSGESNYTCSLWHLSLVRCYLVRGRWCVSTNGHARDSNERGKGARGCTCNLILLMMDQTVRNM